MVSIGDIRRWRPESLEGIFDQLRRSEHRLAGLDDELAASRWPESWTGNAQAAATGQHDKLSERMRRLVAGPRSGPDPTGRSRNLELGPAVPGLVEAHSIRGI